MLDFMSVLTTQKEKEFSWLGFPFPVFLVHVKVMA